ncbi:sigma factor-like helix-turn-helix DNA-binding protein [Nonomuraea aurantiaca]|uniref:sigma factor-like helix-turn-helix DNA-binding protein n=1 Tax=Nonomuraea aurantiaca TaxID=2878562 RepID=UPI003555C08D
MGSCRRSRDIGLLLLSAGRHRSFGAGSYRHPFWRGSNVSTLSGVGTVPSRQRAVIVLRYYEDRTERETAELMNCSIGTVKSQTHYALARVRELAPGLAPKLAGLESEEVYR